MSISGFNELYVSGSIHNKRDLFQASQAIHMPASKRVKASSPREKGPQASSKQRDIGATVIVPTDGERLSLKPKAAKKKAGSTSAAVPKDKAEKQGDNDGEEEISPDEGDDAIKAEEADDDEGDRTTAVINQMDTLCNGAVITICRINLLDPPAKLEFGTWNKRKLVEKRANTLATEIMTSFRPFATTSLLPLILPTEAVDPSCINTNLNSENAPFLKLTSKALSSGMKLQFAGGNHRLRATHIVRDRLVKKIRVWKEQINTTERQLNETAEEGKMKATLTLRLERLEKCLENEETMEVNIGIWGVIVYDAAKMKAKDNAGARHLSKNASIHHYAEGPAEKLDGWLAEYVAERALTEPAPPKAWLADIARHKNSKLGQIFNHAETCLYLELLREYRPHYNEDDIYSIKYCIDKLHHINGGLITYTVKYGMAVLTGLHTDVAIELAGDKKYNAHLDDRTNAEDDEDGYIARWENPVMRSWNALTKRAPDDFTAKGLILSQLEEYDRIFQNNFSMKKPNFMTGAKEWANGFETYREALLGQAKDIAQEPETEEQAADVRDALARKLRFATLDFTDLCSMPSFPIMTKSAITMMTTTLENLELAFTEFWSWLDWSAAYMISKGKKDSSKDLSSWVFRTIVDNNAASPVWDNLMTSKVVDAVRFSLRS
ncbi:hypothetical protein JOM56_015733 [Amanita muscaria]